MQVHQRRWGSAIRGARQIKPSRAIAIVRPVTWQISVVVALIAAVLANRGANQIAAIRAIATVRQATWQARVAVARIASLHRQSGAGAPHHHVAGSRREVEAPST